MAHARQTIREAAAALVTGLTTTGARVYQSRAYNVTEAELPCLLVYTPSEEVEEIFDMGYPRELVRALDLVIEGKAQAAADVDDTLDTIAAEVETAIGADDTLGISVRECTLTGTEMDISSDGEKPTGSVILRYRIIYHTAENTPTVIG